MREADLPDFNDMMELIDLIENLGKRRVVIDNIIKETEAEVVKEMTTNPRYFVNGKIPSISYINATYKVTGLNNELNDLRKELANIVQEESIAKHKLDMLSKMVDVWRTEQANKRKAFL